MTATWEWRNDDFSFVPFKPKDAATLEKAWAMHESTLALTMGPLKYDIDLRAMTQTNVKSGKTRHLRRKGPDGEVVTREAQWEWQGPSDTFVPYDAATSSKIEAAYLRDDLTVKVHLATGAHDEIEMTVHFGHMHQHNPDTDGVRRIRRVVRPVVKAAKAAAKSASPAAVAPEPETEASRVSARAKRDRSKSPPRAATSAASASAPAAAAAHGETQRKPPAPSAAFGPVGPATPMPAVFPPPMAAWRTIDTILALDAHSPPKNASIAVAAFDMDDTLIRPESMDAKKKKFLTFPKSASDWGWLHPTVPARLQELHKNGYCIVIISNQGGIEKDPAKAAWIKTKIIAMQKAAGVPISALAATCEDHNRKPGALMWRAISESLWPGVDIRLDASFYVGDAAGRHITTMAGREKDFSCSDRKFAYNARVRFFTPEEWLLKKAPAAFSWGDMGPADLEKLKAATYDRTTFHSTEKEMIIMVGYPGSGKSTFCKRYLLPHGYVHINRDTLKSLDKCCSVAHAELAAGKSVVIDNTSPCPSDRLVYQNIAKKHGAKCRCFWMDVSQSVANHFNVCRAMLGITRRVPTIAYRTFSGKYREPTMADGFDEVVRLPFVPDFAGLPDGAADLIVGTLS